jgi:hypothetical protein
MTDDDWGFLLDTAAKIYAAADDGGLNLDPAIARFDCRSEPAARAITALLQAFAEYADAQDGRYAYLEGELDRAEAALDEKEAAA